MEAKTIIVLVLCLWAATSSATSVLHFGMLKEDIKWWEKLLMIIGGFLSLLIVMTFTLMLLIEKLK
jgi:hypothetical protein